MRDLIKQTRAYLDYIEEHYDNVQKAWELIQAKCKNMNFIYDDHLFFQLDGAIKNHDISKLSQFEFVQYRKKFFPVVGEVVDKEQFNKAWEHHKINNDHHWQTWTMEGYGKNQVIALVHNIVDWVAMGFKFGDTAQAYYEKNKEEIRLPDWAEREMYSIFKCIY